MGSVVQMNIHSRCNGTPSWGRPIPKLYEFMLQRDPSGRKNSCHMFKNSEPTHNEQEIMQNYQHNYATLL